MQREMCTAFREVIGKVCAYIQGQYSIPFVKHNGELLNLVILRWDVSLSFMEVRDP